MACGGEWLPHLVVAEYMTSKHLFFFAFIYFMPIQTHASAGDRILATSSKWEPAQSAGDCL
jgi:hypothetical protein